MVRLPKDLFDNYNITMLPDFPKVQSPFERVLKKFDEYLVTPKITPGYEWVFEDPNVICVEKLDGTNISLKLENKRVVSIQNRKNIIDPWSKSTVHIMEGIYEALKKGYLNLEDGVYFGELIGPKLQGNPYDLEKHIWIPFVTYAKNSLSYKSWGKYDISFDSISNWFENDIFSLYYRKIHKGEKKKSEGVMFYHPDGRIAKLRLDMYDWYKGRRHRA